MKCKDALLLLALWLTDCKGVLPLLALCFDEAQGCLAFACAVLGGVAGMFFHCMLEADCLCKLGIIMALYVHFKTVQLHPSRI